MARGIGGGRPYTRGRGGGGYRGGGSSGGYRGRNESRSYEGRNRYDSYDSRQSSKFSSNDRYGARRNDFKRPIPHYRDESRDRRVSPDRKRFRREYPPNQKKAYRDNRKSTDEKELDLENFMTVDEIGDVDLDVANVEFPDDGGDDSETASSTKDQKASSDKDKNTSASTSRDNKQSKSATESINVGSEHIKKVEALYCGLCRMYLPRREEKDAATRRHCGTRSHLRLYIRYRDDKQLREEAEKIHRRHQEDREAAKAAATATTTSADGTEVTVKKEKDDTEEGSKKATGDDKEKDNEMDMKMWADVDKDLGDLLREVAPEVVDEDEEDSRNNTERYDRFKNSDKVDDDGDKAVQEQGEASAKLNGSTDTKAAAAVSSEVVPVTE